jgi:hypothetical protein
MGGRRGQGERAVQCAVVAVAMAGVGRMRGERACKRLFLETTLGPVARTCFRSPTVPSPGPGHPRCPGSRSVARLLFQSGTKVT